MLKCKIGFSLEHTHEAPREDSPFLLSRLTELHQPASDLSEPTACALHAQCKSLCWSAQVTRDCLGNFYTDIKDNIFLNRAFMIDPLVRLLPKALVPHLR